MSEFNDRFAVVTGASSGIGLKLTETLLGHGATVLAMARREGPPESLHAHSGKRLHWLAGDVTRERDLDALAIRLDSKGPVLFRQKRYGYNNRLIWVFKFRSMYTERTDANAERQTTRDDDRITRVGRFIRKTSIDELPQLFNVLAGSMSMVGPRPHATATKAAGIPFEEAVSEYSSRHRVKPGITGWAQINGYRGETDTLHKIKKRVEYDLEYIAKWSVWFDLYILFRTVPAVLLTKEVY